MHKKKIPIPTAPQKSCGKNRYNSEKEATEIARQQELLFANKNLKLKHYFCASCGGWHLANHTT